MLGSKSESMFSFSNDVERDKATKICPGENDLCLINSNETIVQLSRVRPWTLWTVDAHAKGNGNWGLLNVSEEFLLMTIFASCLYIGTTLYFEAYKYFNIAFLPAFWTSNLT